MVIWNLETWFLMPLQPFLQADVLLVQGPPIVTVCTQMNAPGKLAIVTQGAHFPYICFTPFKFIIVVYVYFIKLNGFYFNYCH
jgi:hypothetical protein